MQYYSYSAVTGEFLGSKEARRSPRELGKYLLPANATFTDPGEIPAGKAAVWNGEEWDLVSDYRGRTAYNTTTGEASVIRELGEIAGNLTFEPRPSRFHEYQNGSWVENTAEKEAYESRLTAHNTLIASVQARLDSLITELNAKYSALDLQNTDTLAVATGKLLAVAADFSDCNNLKLLYETLTILNGTEVE